MRNSGVNTKTRGGGGGGAAGARASASVQPMGRTRVEEISTLQAMEDPTAEQVDISWRICSLCKSTQKQSYPEVLYPVGGTPC